MTKRNRVGLIYFGVVLVTLALRVASSLDIYSALNITSETGMDACYTVIVQIFIFGLMPFALYSLTVCREKGNLLPMVQDFGIKPISGKNLLWTILMGVLMIIICSAFSMVWQIVLTLLGYTHASSPTDYSNIGMLFLQLVLTAVLPALFEEFSHRGLIYAGYKDCGYKFVIVSALMFSLMHQNIVQTGYTFVAGLIMALMMYYTGSIVPGIIMHFMNNAHTVVSGYIAQNGGILSFIVKIGDFLRGTLLGWFISVFVALGCVVGAVFLFIRLRKDAVNAGIVSGKAFAKTGEKPLCKDIYFLVTVAVGVVATIFSFVWGILR